MAAGWKKLKVGEGHSVEAAVSYLADPQARGDYYTEGGSFMRWLATHRARTHFALGDGVSRSALAALLSGRSPVDGSLIRRYGPDGTLVGGIDVTLSPAPKSVSILWALADDELRAELEELVLLSVNGAIGRMLDEVPLVRERFGPGPRDVRRVRAEDWVGVQVLHTTARLSKGRDIPDPQLHVHNVLIGALDQAGRLRAIDTYPISLFRSELDAQASADLAERLRRRGWPIERRLVRGPAGRVKRVAWEVAGVPSSLVRAMSARRAEVEDLREQYRQATGREPEGAGWERFLEQHRGQKARRSEYEMYVAWEEEATEHEFGGERVAAMRRDARAAEDAGVEPRLAGGAAADQLRREILADLCRDHALVPERELNKLAMQRSMGLMHPYEAMRVVAEMFGDGDLLASTDGKVTTLEVLAAEQRSIAAAERLLDAKAAAPATPDELRREFDRAEDERRPFDEAQRRAVEVATSGARLVSITGPAGTGKGLASRPMTAIWRRQGRRVIAAAVAGRTARQAEADSGADVSYTLNQLQAMVDGPGLGLRPTDVLLVDEAGMIDHQRYAPLLEAIADAGATLVQVGDDKQLSPVGPGGLWTVVHRMAEDRGRTAELEVVRRARDPREAQAWTDLREGRVEEALTWYRDEGRLRLYDTRPELLAGLVEEWWHSADRGVMVVDSSNAERDELNRMAQQRRLATGELGAEPLMLTNGREIRAGDRVLFNGTYRPLPEQDAVRPPKRVENGTAATVLAVDRLAGTATVRLHEPKADRELTIPATVPVELGYARHIYKAQGMSAEVGNVATGPNTRHNELYTMITRSRDGTWLHALRVEVEEMGANPANLEPVAPRAVEERQGIPADATPVAEFMAGVEAARAKREAEEAVTIREIAKRAGRSSTKEAIGARSWSPPAEQHAERATAADAREERLASLDQELRRDVVARRAQPVGSTSARRRTVRPMRRDQITMLEPMPARDMLESVGRPGSKDFDAAKVLAYQEVRGRLHVGADLAEVAADRWLTDREAVIVVPDQETADKIVAAVERLASEQTSNRPRSKATPRVVLSEPAYQERRARREAWARTTAPEQRHRVEPGAVERAYVVVPDVAACDNLVRGLSVAAESHLITVPPNAWVAANARAAVERLRSALAATEPASARHPVATAAEAQIDHGRQPRVLTRDREAERA